ncbi:hypothetical protein VNO80_07066 [Phaseolus coccineus]|uniref:BZIP domain-containing protein n=1 Tax=Phaseolus coccineus TaxID=3886 RepID=A0AAN9NIK1_PHACN
MSLPIETKVNTNNNTPFPHLKIKEGETPSSSRPPSSSHVSFPPIPTTTKKLQIEDSDEDVFTVPDVEAALSVDSATTNPCSSNVNQSHLTDPHIHYSGFSGKRRQGRNPLEKEEHRRHKRLLRNRVSAQQARERKKVYLNELESSAVELEEKNTNLEEQISTLINENTMLRKVLMNKRAKVDDNNEA